MLETLPLPPSCVIRPARPTDRKPIRILLNQFRQEILPPPSQWAWVQRWGAIAVLAGTAIYLSLSLSWQELLNLLLGPSILIGLATAIAYVLTWNSEWNNFWVAESNNQIVACAKLRCLSQYSLLHDLYVVPEWRSQGLGSYLVTYLGQQATKPLYLTCLPKLTTFYMRLGFRPVMSNTLPPLIQYDLGLAGRLDVIPLVLR